MEMPCIPMGLRVYRPEMGLASPHEKMTAINLIELMHLGLATI